MEILHLAFVLIETLWNVKINPAIGLNCFVFVLIETLWNVKAETQIERFYESTY